MCVSRLLVLTIIACVATVPASAVEKPSLVVFISVDQLRGDMPGRMYDRFGYGGFRYLMDHGVIYSNAHYRHATTYTASGHATLVTGGNPAEHGLIGNSWYNRDYPGESFYALADTEHSVLNGDNGPGIGTSPKNLMSTTIGDELVSASNGASRVFSVSLKDRAAIAMGGRSGKAFWLDTKTGQFTSSTYYFDDSTSLPDWVQSWNTKSHALSAVEESGNWQLLLNDNYYRQKDHDARPFELDPAGIGSEFPHHLPTDEEELAGAIRYSPFGDILTVEFAKELVQREALGQRGTTDILMLSLSCTDYIGHMFGPESLEQEEICFASTVFLRIGLTSSTSDSAGRKSSTCCPPITVSISFRSSGWNNTSTLGVWTPRKLKQTSNHSWSRNSAPIFNISKRSWTPSSIWTWPL